MNLLSDAEIRRFNNQINFPRIGAEGLLKIRNSNIALIGAGSIGAAALQYLSASGFSHIGIIDYAMVSETDIQRQSLYGGADLGKLKTIISKQRLRDIFPLIHYEIINLQITAMNADSILKPYDLIIDATNNTQCISDLTSGMSDTNKSLVHTIVRGSKIGITALKLDNEKKILPNWVNLMPDNVSSLPIAYGFAGLLTVTEAVKIITGAAEAIYGKQVIMDCLDYSFLKK